MKLRNKETGQIFDTIQPVLGGEGSSIAELLEEWEDYEEPKKYYYLDYGGRIKAMNDANDEEDIARKAIGNYFETREEAEKAVERLKAWKRLKDRGFRFKKWDYSGGMHIEFEFIKQSWATETEPDLDLLFGGEE